nr:hypothetical protein [Tanacetum cinerariifolium]
MLLLPELRSVLPCLRGVNMIHDRVVCYSTYEPECSKFVTDVKLAKDMHSASFDQLYAYLRQHEVHANEVRMMRQRFPDPLALVANTHIPTSFYNTQQYNQPHYNQNFLAFSQQQQFYSPPPPQQSYEKPVVHHQSYEAPIFHQQPYQAPTVYHQSPAVFPQLDSSLVVPKFLPTDDPIESLNKEMTFLSIVITSRYPQTNNQLRTSSNPMNQAIIQDGRLESQKLLKHQLFRSLKDWEVSSDTETEEGHWLELQFSLADNSKLSVVYLLNRS